ncbi:MAG: 3-phosphoshikimate 1-carboxyvinyltransferase [Pyrinomonadaceae bacterium]
MKIRPARYLQGQINLPGDKSISHRAALFSALAEGRARIENFASSRDCASTLNCLRSLGVRVEREGATVLIEGVGKNGFSTPGKDLDCGNSGTTMRLLAGALAGQSFASVLTGDESLSLRPMRRIIDPLGAMGARIESIEGHAPLRIFGRNPLRSSHYSLPVASAQVKSCVLLAGLNADGKTVVDSPPSGKPVPASRNHTELLLASLGAGISEEFLETPDGFVHRVSIDGDSRLTAGDLQVPADISSAAFFLTAAACLEGSEIVLPNVGLNPTRAAVVEVLRGFGAGIEVLDQREVGGETVGDLRVRGGSGFVPSGKSNIISGEIIANLIDEIPVLAVFGTQIEGGLEIRGAGELRVKESDRIAATVENLRRMGAGVEEFPDGLRVVRSKLRGARVESFGDHRIAMAFAVAGLLAEGETVIDGADCAAVSFPEFFEVLAGVVRDRPEGRPA